MTRSRRRLAVLLAALCLPAAAWAKVDLVTLPSREKVQLTIYNSADLTLMRDTRTLTMRKGENRLQFAWAGTLIDPTSLELLPRADAAKIHVAGIQYPPRVTGLGIWNLDSEISGKVPFELSCFTSGVSWQAYTLATLTPDERAMRLEGYVRVNNQSGEDYEGAETRLVVGKINLLDRIADLARRPEPYGRPGGYYLPAPAMVASEAVMDKAEMMPRAKMAMAGAMRPKEIVKEGLSEYFLYTIEGTEDLPNGWGKRLISFTAPVVPVENLYRYDEQQFGPQTVRFLSFANDEKHALGKEPLPDGLIKVFRRTDAEGHLAYVGAQTSKYIPKGEEVKLNLGPSDRVRVQPTRMELTTDNFEWRDDNITGWDEHETVKLEIANRQDIPVKVEVRRSFPVRSWEIKTEGDPAAYEKVDADTVQYTLELPAHAKRTLTYRVTLHQGTRGVQ